MFKILYNFNGLNEQIFLLINNYTNVSILPRILQIISWAFDISKFAIYYVVLLIYFYLRLKKVTNPELLNIKFLKIYRNMVNVGITYTIFGLIYAAFKFTINLPRPFCSLPIDGFSTIADITHQRCLSSFPSAHTGLAVLIAYFLWPYLNKLSMFAALIIMILTSISRITLAMHYPADILYSIIIAIIVIIISNYIYRLLQNNLIRVCGNFIFKKIFQ